MEQRETISQIAESVISEMERMQYSPQTISTFRVKAKHLSRYVQEETGTDYFTEELGRRYLGDTIGFPFAENRGQTSPESVHIRCIRRIREHQLYRAVLRNYSQIISDYAALFYFRFLRQNGIGEYDWSFAVPKVIAPRNRNAPALWEKDDWERLLKGIDRGSPEGKRDYAIILLVVELGLRISYVSEPMSAAANVMGHTSYTSTLLYWKVDIEGLRECARSLGEVPTDA